MGGGGGLKTIISAAKEGKYRLSHTYKMQIMTLGQQIYNFKARGNILVEIS